jgi:hypothetical protein
MKRATSGTFTTENSLQTRILVRTAGTSYKLSITLLKLRNFSIDPIPFTHKTSLGYCNTALKAVFSLYS